VRRANVAPLNLGSDSSLIVDILLALDGLADKAAALVKVLIELRV
jgi:hypothetical protein